MYCYNCHFTTKVTIPWSRAGSQTCNVDKIVSEVGYPLISSALRAIQTFITLSEVTLYSLTLLEAKTLRCGSSLTAVLLPLRSAEFDGAAEEERH